MMLTQVGMDDNVDGFAVRKMSGNVTVSDSLQASQNVNAAENMNVGQNINVLGCLLHQGTSLGAPAHRMRA